LSDVIFVCAGTFWLQPKFSACLYKSFMTEGALGSRGPLTSTLFVAFKSWVKLNLTGSFPTKSQNKYFWKSRASPFFQTFQRFNLGFLVPRQPANDYLQWRQTVSKVFLSKEDTFLDDVVKTTDEGGEVKTKAKRKWKRKKSDKQSEEEEQPSKQQAPSLLAVDSIV
jgi:hypothetical protein